jgi:hypothetical protein
MKTGELLLNIQQLIDKARCGVDGFFTDSRAAARDIVTYLQMENLLGKADVIEMQHNRAA